jgi:hypothetical protein
MHSKMANKKNTSKQRNIKQNSKQALDFLKSKNSKLQTLINAFDLELSNNSEFRIHNLKL